MSDIPATLSFVSISAQPETLNLVLYGPAGSGKTTGACSAPGPLLVLNAEGTGALRYSRRIYGADKIREVKFDDANTLAAVLTYLKAGNDIQTVVVDSIGAIYGRLLELIGGAKPQIQHYGTVNTIIIRFVRQLRDLPVNVVLIAHEKIDDQEGDRIVRPLTGGQQLPEQIMQEMDVVAYLGVVQDDKQTRYVAQLAQDRGRRAKDRTGLLGRSRDVDLTEWIKVANTAPDQDPLPWDEPADDENAEGPVQAELGAAA